MAIDAVQQKDPEARQWVARAREKYQRAIAIDEHHAEAYVGLGRTYLLTPTEQMDVGLQILEASRQLLPTNLEAHLLIGHLLFATEDFEGARHHYDEVISWSRNPTVINRAKGMIELISAQTATSSIGAGEDTAQ